MPPWVFGQSTYAFLADRRIACLWSSDGFPHLGVLDGGSMEELHPQRLPTARSARIRSDERRLAYVGASPTLGPAVVLLDGGDEALVARARGDADPRHLPGPHAIPVRGHRRTPHPPPLPPRH